MSVSAADGILMNLVVTEPGQEAPACPWGLAVNAAGDPCDGHTCALCSAAALRDKGGNR